ncbi:hypothetical protein K445DRAFT_24033 [Daldinia sp. EC12]|nr:hypothetical protein K445DRAFT_24033 [Daldinia sp. EC12]
MLPDDVAQALLYYDVAKSRVDEALRLVVWHSEAASTPNGLYAASQPEEQYKRAEVAGATAVELECGHSPFLIDSEIAALVDIITKVVTA